MAGALPVLHRHNPDLRPDQEDFAKSIQDVERKLCGNSTGQVLSFSADSPVKLAVFVFEVVQPRVKRAAILATLCHHLTPAYVSTYRYRSGTLHSLWLYLTLRPREAASSPQNVPKRPLAFAGQTP